MALPAGFQLEEPLGLPTGFQLENTAPEKPPETGIIAGLKSGVNQFLSPAQTGIQALLGNEEEAARAGLKRQEEEAKKFEGPSFARIGQKYDQNGVLSAAKEVATDIPVALAQQAPLITAMGVGSWIGGGIGGTLGGIGGSFVTPVVGTAAGAVGGAALGAKVGSAIGQAIVEFPQFFGSDIERQAQEQIKAGKPIDIDKTNAAVSAMGQTATDIFEMQVLFGGKYLGNLLGLSEKELANKSVGALEKQAREKFLPSISEGTLGYGVKGTAKGMAVEIPTEIAQQMMERAQAGLSLTSPDALAEYGDTAYQVGLLGPLGVVGSMASKSGAKGELEKRALDEEQKVYQDKVDEYKKLQDQLSQTYQNLGVNNIGENGRQILALPAPAPQVLEETGHPLQNPLGNFGVDALHPEEVKYLDQYRNQLGLPKLQSYSIEDIKDAMTNLHPEGEQGVIDRLLTTKLGYTGQEVAGKPVTAKDVENIANLKNLDTTTSGFSDFLTRTTGHDDLATLSNPQLLSVFNAISSTERSPELQVLQPSTNATAFSQTQYDKALDGVKAVLGMGNRTTATDNTILNEVKDFTGLTDKHAKSLLKTAINNGDLEAYSKHRFDVVDANGKPLPMIFPKTREEAQAIAKKKGLDPENNVKATAYQEISLPGVINKLPVGPDIRQETFKQGVEPAFTVQRGNQTVSAPLNEQEAQAHLDDLQKQQDLNIRNLQTQIKAKQLAIKQSKTILDRLALDGKKDTPQYQQVAAHINDKNNKLQLEIDRLNNQVLTQDHALDLVPAGEKPVLSTGFTYYHNGQKTSTFPTVEEAQDFSVTMMDDKLLNQIIKSAPAQKGLIPKRLEVMAKKELDRRAGKGQKGIAVTATGTKEEASKNLAKMGIYSPLVTEHLEELRNKLMPELKRFGLEKVGLRILNSIENGKADGFYVRGLMTVAYDSDNPFGTLRHEVIHALRELGGFRPEEWKVLMNKAKSEWIDTYIKKTGLYEKYKAQFESDHGNLDGFDDYISEEAIAEAFKHFSKTKPPAGLVGNLYHRISELFKSLFKAFRSIGATSVEDIFSNIEEGKIQPIDLSKAGEEVKFAKKPVTKEEIIADGIKRYGEAVDKHLTNYWDGEGSASGRGYVALEKVEDGIRKRLKEVGVSEEKNIKDQFGNPISEMYDIWYSQITPKSRAYAKKIQSERRASFENKEKSEVSKEGNYALRPDEPRKLPNGNIIGSPPDAKDERSRTALVKRMTNLLEHPFSMYEKSKDWYERSGDTIREVSHGDKDLMEKLIRLTALYSQANSLGGNITAVIKSMAQIANGDKEILAGRFPNTTAKRIPAILAAKTMDDSVAGVDDKLMNFYRNLHDGTFKTDTFQDASTIDRWMMRLFGYPHAEDQDEGGASSVSATQYKYAKDLIRRIADANEKKTGDKLHPRQIQAVLWTYVKNQSEEKKHNENPKKKGEFAPSALDFSDYMNRATAHITWESRPSTSVDLIPGIHEAPKKYQHQFNQAIHSIFTNKDGSNKIMEMLSKLVGNHVMYSSDLSVGAYEDHVTPNIVTKIVLQKDESQHATEIADMYSNIIGYVTMQDAVPWYRPDPTASGKYASKGFKITANKTMDQKFIDKLFKHLNSAMPGIGFTKIGNSLDFINYRDENGKPFGMPDKKYEAELNKALESFDDDVEFSSQEFKAQGNYLSNDWKENKNGEAYLSRFSEGQLSDIRSTIDGWRNDYERIARGFGDEHKWHKYALRPEQSAIRPSGRSTKGIVLGEKQEQAVSFEGIHYGKEKTNELRGNYSGSGIKGAEQARLAKAEDRRIKNRVYFYIPRSNEIMPFREAGLGNFVYEQKFDNILAPGETMRSLNTGDFNEFESNVIEAGFDGYAVPDMGMMVILNHDVPVEYKGTIDELRGKYALRAPDTKEFKDWFGDSKVVNADGSPKVMYHGTLGDIKAFRPSFRGAYFASPDPEFASDFITESGTKDVEEIEGANVIPVFVKAEKVFDYENPNHLDKMSMYFGDDSVTMEEIADGNWSMLESREAQDAMQGLGFDGFYIYEQGVKNIAVFEPNQIKSAFNQKPTESADIRYALALNALEPTTYLVSDAHPNNTGDLAYIPFNASIPKMPIRMTVGTHDNILNKGYGGNHILTRIRENPNRKPDVSASDLLENIILQAEETGKKFTQIYKDNSQYILFDPLSKNMMVIHPEKGFYSITTMYKDERVPFKHGKPVWSGRNIQPPVPQAFQEKQQGFPVRAGERGIETLPVKTTVKKRRVISPSQVEKKAYALRIDNAPPLKLTKLAPAQTAGQKIHDVTTAIQNAWHSDDFFTGLRVAWVDPSAGLSNRLQGKDAWDMHGLRADMLHRAKSQMINIIHNGLQIGIPVLNKDKSIVIERTEDNLARTHIMADALDANPYVQGSGLTGRGFVAEVARALRGREILAEDKARQAEGIKQLEQAKQLVRDANKATTVKEQRRLLSQAEHLRKLGNENKQMNRELQVTPEQLAWAEQQLKNVPEVQNILDIWKSVNNSLIDLREATGLLTKAQADDYRSKESYVPLFMAEEDLEDHFGSLRPSGAKSIKEIQRLKGSELTRNIWENLERNYASTIALAYENQTRKVAVDQLVSVDAAKISTASDPEVNLRFKDDQHPDADSHGIVHAVVYNPNDVLAFQNMHYELTPLMKGFSAVTNVLRAGALLNPMFWIRQLIRDSIHSTVVTDSGIVTPFHAAKEFISILKNDSREFSILFERGVVGPRDSTVDFHDFLSQVGQEKTKTTTIKKAIHKIMMYHESSDAATRVSIFKDAEKKALAQGMSPEDAVNFAVYKARESINFSVHGNGKILNDLRHMIPFFSASITSLDTVYRAATGYGLPPKEKAAAQKLFKQRAMMMVVMCTAYAMMMQDDDEYKKQPDYVKDGNWLIPTGSGFIKVPVPFEVGFLFKTIPEAAVRYMAGTSTGKEVIASYQSGLIQNLPGNLVPIPQAGRPLLEVITNYSFFRSQAIESVGDQNLPVSQRGRNASEVAKMLSGLGLDKIRLSPAKIDYLIQGYMAELGTSSTTLASSVLYMAEGKTPPDTNFEKMPFFKSFVTDPNADKAVSDFYNIEKNSTEVAAAFNKMKASGMGKEAMEYMAQGNNQTLIAYAPTMRRLGLQMTKIRKAINIVESDQSMSPTERRTRMNELTQMYNRVAEQNVKIARTAGLE